MTVNKEQHRRQIYTALGVTHTPPPTLVHHYPIGSANVQGQGQNQSMVADKDSSPGSTLSSIVRVPHRRTVRY